MKKIDVWTEGIANTLTGDGNERKRDYTNENHWILDHTKAPLKPFYDFLKIHLD